MIGQLRDEEEWETPGPMPIDSLDEDDPGALPPHDDIVVVVDDPDMVVEDVARQAASDAAALPPVLQDTCEKLGFSSVRVHVGP